MDKSNIKGGYVLHLDGDAFFASCESSQHPELSGKPIVVGRERGIATAFSYEAKALGVTRGMPIYKIKKNFPNVIILPTHFELYKMYNIKMLSILRRHLDLVEDYSIDECFAYVPENYSWNEACKLSRKIKDELQLETGLTFSFGLAKTKVLAKVASKHQKPNGITYINEENINQILANTKIEKIWGIGSRTSEKLISEGIDNAFKFKNLGINYIEKKFDKPLQEIWYELNENPKLAVTSGYSLPKSIQATRTFSKNTSSLQEILSEISRNVEIACLRARSRELYSNIFSFFLKDSNFKYYTKEIKMDFYSNNPSDYINKVTSEIADVYNKYSNYRSSGITLLNLRLKGDYSSDFFGKQESIFYKNDILVAVDNIKNKLGNESVILASSLTSQKQRLSDKFDSTDNYIYDLPYPYLGEVN